MSPLTEEGLHHWDAGRVGPEPKKAHVTRSHAPMFQPSFYSRFCQGQGLDIGYGGGSRHPVLPNAIGVDQDYPGYSGTTLPFKDESKDYIFSSHCLEHISIPVPALREWFRVIKTRGHLIITVPHQFLYEKKNLLPSLYNTDHKRFYTPSELLYEIEVAFTPNTYRIRHLRDNDDNFNYSIPPELHSTGCYEIEIVIQKIQKPDWDLL